MKLVSKKKSSKETRDKGNGREGGKKKERTDHLIILDKKNMKAL